MMCGFCFEEIINMNGRQSNSHVTHHKNGNRKDTRPENELDCHYGCHTSHHHSGEKNHWYGKKLSPEHLANISKGRKGKNTGPREYKFTKEHKNKISKALKGKKLSHKHKLNMRLAHLDKKDSEETKEKKRQGQRKRRKREREEKGI